MRRLVWEEGRGVKLASSGYTEELVEYVQPVLLLLLGVARSLAISSGWPNGELRWEEGWGRGGALLRRRGTYTCPCARNDRSGHFPHIPYAGLGRKAKVGPDRTSLPKEMRCFTGFLVLVLPVLSRPSPKARLRGRYNSNWEHVTHL